MSLGLAALGLTLRAETDTDLPFLLALYRSTRAAEMAPVPWTQARKDAFLDDQFRLQRAHFLRHFPQAGFWIVEAGEAIGRLYLDKADRWRIIDIALMPQARGKGAGGALIRWVQAEARAAAARGLDLHVALTNPSAARLYRRLGFVDAGLAEGPHQPMTWAPRTARGGAGAPHAERLGFQR